MRTDRNFDGVQLERLRKEWDGHFNQLHDELEDAYYGPKDAEGRFIPGTGWRNGESRPLQGLDVTVESLPVKLAAHLKVEPDQEKLTAEQAKQLFDLLHGPLWQAHTLWLHKMNAQLAEPYPEDELNPETEDAQGEKVRKVELERLAMDALASLSGIDMVALVRERHPAIDLSEA